MTFNQQKKKVTRPLNFPLSLSLFLSKLMTPSKIVSIVIWKILPQPPKHNLIYDLIIIIIIIWWLTKSILIGRPFIKIPKKSKIKIIILSKSINNDDDEMYHSSMHRNQYFYFSGKRFFFCLTLIHYDKYV